MGIRRRNAVDQSGKPVILTEHTSEIPLRTNDGFGSMPGLSSMRGPDGEQLTPDGDWFRGIHSDRRYKLV